MLLTDLVGEGAGADLFRGMSTSTAAASRLAKRGKRKVVAKGKAPRAIASAAGDADDEDAEFGGMGMDFSGDENEAVAGPGGDKLLAAIGSLGSGEVEADDAAGTSAMKARRAAMQAGAESEFHTGAVGEEVTVEDLLAPLAEGPSFGNVRKQLESLARHEKLPEPASEPKRNREDRAAQYEATKKDQKKWIPQIQQMRKADQVVLSDVKATEQPDNSTGALVGAFKPVDDFEKELEEITRAAGTTEQDLKGAQALPVNPRIRDEKQVQQVARLKALILREQQMNKRVNKIKSKTYRRIHRKAETREREVLLDRLEHENPELAKQLKQEYEKKRAQMRLMRQRSARKKWTTTMQRFAKGDKGAQQEISKQAQQAHDEHMSLRRAVQGKDPDQSEESDAVDLSASDSDEEAEGGKRKSLARRTIDKAKKLTVDELKNLEKGGELPTSGVLGMKFMKEAIKRKREEARGQAKNVLQELEGLTRDLNEQEPGSDEGSDGDEANLEKAKAGSSTGKPRAFTEEELAAARKEVDAIWENPEHGVDCSVSGPLTVKGVTVASNPAPPGAAASTRGRQDASLRASASSEAAGADGGGGSSSSNPSSSRKKRANANTQSAAVSAPNPWLDLAGDQAIAAGEDGSAAAVEAAFRAGASSVPTEAASGVEDKRGESAPSAGGGDSRSAKKRKRKKDMAQQPVEQDDEVAQHAEDVLSALNADSAEAQEQRDLVRTAFVEGTQLEDFDDEQEDIRRKKDEEADLAEQKLAGWGSWTGAGVKPKRPKGAGKGKGKLATKQQDNPRPSRVQFLEGKTTEAAKYFVDKVPFPFQNPQQYEQGMKMPTGPEWNAMPAFMQKVKPKFFMKTGAIVPPLEYVKHLPEEHREGAIKSWAAPKQPRRLKAKI